MSEKLTTDAKMVLIGGGNATSAKQSRPLLEGALEMTGKDRPSVLLVPTPKIDGKYQRSVEATSTMFDSELGLPFEVLHGDPTADSSHWSQAELDEKIGQADMIYVTGGNTQHAIDVWRQHGIDQKIVRKNY